MMRRLGRVVLDYLRYAGLFRAASTGVAARGAFWPRLPHQPRRGVRFAYGYFVFTGLLAGAAFVTATTRLLLDESLPRAEILLANANIVLAAVSVPPLLLLAASRIRRGSRWGAGLAALGFILMAPWVPKIGVGGLVMSALIVSGLGLAVTAWAVQIPRGCRRHAGTPDA